MRSSTGSVPSRPTGTNRHRSSAVLPMRHRSRRPTVGAWRSATGRRRRCKRRRPSLQRRRTRDRRTCSGCSAERRGRCAGCRLRSSAARTIRAGGRSTRRRRSATSRGAPGERRADAAIRLRREGRVCRHTRVRGTPRARPRQAPRTGGPRARLATSSAGWQARPGNVAGTRQWRAKQTACAGDTPSFARGRCSSPRGIRGFPVALLLTPPANRMRAAHSNGCAAPAIQCPCGDSALLVVRQPHLSGLHEVASGLVAQFGSIRISWVPRERSTREDCSRGID